MRDAIRKRLAAKVPAVGSRVYEVSTAGPKTQKPYLVVKYTGDADTKMRYGFDVGFEVWAYTEQTSNRVLDAIARKVISALHRQDLVTDDGLQFQLRYTGQGPDYDDPDWEALGRRLSFTTERIIGG